MKTIKGIKPLTLEYINQINLKAKNEDIILVFDNTKGLSKQIINKLDNKVTISITGGLNPKKEKFNNSHYQKRTYYSPKELSLIIDKFEKIEKHINPLWNDLEKSMYIYKSLCESFTYSKNIFNNRDAARNLLGMITNQSVCSGFALIYKEAMDRINIPCIYQNRETHHSWNFILIDGKYRSVELTWDTSNKNNNKCGFNYFCRDNKDQFYNNKHHNIDDESEEIKYDVEKIPTNTLADTLKKISLDKFFSKKLDSSKKIKVAGKTIVIVNNTPYINNAKMNNCTFIRNDDTSFLVFPTGNYGKGVKEYVYLIYNPETNAIKATKIYSEMDLATSNLMMKDNIANNLMSVKRMYNKINEFNGYIGYVTYGNRTRYFNQDFEENVINKYR